MIKRYVFAFKGEPKSANTDTYYDKIYLSLWACKAGVRAFIGSNKIKTGRFTIYEVDLEMNLKPRCTRDFTTPKQVEWIDYETL